MAPFLRDSLATVRQRPVTAWQGAGCVSFTSLASSESEEFQDHGPVAAYDFDAVPVTSSTVPLVNLTVVTVVLL